MVDSGISKYLFDYFNQIDSISFEHNQFPQEVMLSKISFEIDLIDNLISEGKILLATLEDNANSNEIKNLIESLNQELVQHLLRMSILKWGCLENKTHPK